MYMAKRRIYLDHAASTPLEGKALKAMMPFLKKEFGNPSSMHAFGQVARAAIEDARESVAELLKASASEIFFTSGATEANNLAIKGAVKGWKYKRTPHVITSQIEHESVLEPIRELESRGEVNVTYVPVGKDGIVDVDEVLKAVKRDTLLVSMQYVNSEIGTVQPVAKIGKELKRSNPDIIFHVDAVQAVSFLECSVARLHVDLLTISAHKMYGPKGVGALYVKEGTNVVPMVFGGGQEEGMRSGTENVASIVGFGVASHETTNGRTEIASVRIRQLRDKMIREIPKRVAGVELNGSSKDRISSNASFSIDGVRGSDLVMSLDRKGVAVSTGSACSERSQEASHVLKAMGLPDERALSSIRITVGKHTTKEEIEKFITMLPPLIKQLRGE